MNYPTREEIEAADREQLCRWWRFLPSPGAGAVGEYTFAAALERESLLMKRIGERLEELGGFTAEISKKLGWEPPRG